MDGERGSDGRTMPQAMLSDEERRVAEPWGSSILDAVPEAGFGDLIGLASRLCRAPAAMIGFIDDDRFRLKAALGIARGEIPLAAGPAAAAAAFRQPDLLVVSDLLADCRFAGLLSELSPPPAAGEWRFLASAAILDDAGGGSRPVIGRICVLDHAPRRLDDGEAEALGALARQAAALVALPRTAAALDAARLRTAAILEGTSDAFYAVDTEWRFTYVNRTAERIWRRSREDLLGRRLWDEFPENVGGHAYQEIVRAARERRPVEFETMSLQTGDWIAVRIFPDAGGLSIYFRDIAARKRLEGELRRRNEQLQRLTEERSRQLAASRARLRAFFENSPDWLTLLRVAPDGQVRYEDLNPTTEQAYGMPRDAVIGRTLEEVLGPPGAEVPLRHAYACVRTGETQRYALRRTMNGVTRTIDVMFALVPEQDDAGPEGVGDRFIITTARDITEREQLEEQLRQAQKMEAVGQITGGVAHDFNNLLTAISGNLELIEMRADADGDGTVLRQARAAKRAAERGAALTRQLLAFSRKQHLVAKPVDLNEVVAGMDDLLRRTMGGLVQVRTRPAAGLWPALVDPTQIELVLLNLAINARDAMPEGGTLTIATANLPAGDPALPADLGACEGGAVRIAVSDTGTGMSEMVAARAFEPFFTTKEIGRGSGLGLSMVYGLAQQSGGTATIETRPGAGTTVSVLLPRAADAAAGAGLSPAGRADAPLPSAGAEGGGARILVVDDDGDVREMTVQCLREFGHEVTAAASGGAALDLLGAGVACDLLLVDVAMPGLNGAETARRAREIRPGLRVLFATGYAESVGFAAQQTGVDPVIRKPFTLEALRRSVRAVLASGDAQPAPP